MEIVSSSLIFDRFFGLIEGGGFFTSPIKWHSIFIAHLGGTSWMVDIPRGMW